MQLLLLLSVFLLQLLGLLLVLLLQLLFPGFIRTYNNLWQLLSVLHQIGTNTIDGAVYTVDPAGNRTRKRTSTQMSRRITPTIRCPYGSPYGKYPYGNQPDKQQQIINGYEFCKQCTLLSNNK